MLKKIVAQSDADVIAGALHTVGYVPSNSIVLALSGGGGELKAALRIDLPDPLFPPTDFAQTVVSGLAGYDFSTARVFLFDSVGRDDLEGYLDGLLIELTAARIKTTGVYLITEEGWQVWGEDTSPQPLSMIFESQLSLEMNIRGHQIQPKLTIENPQPDENESKALLSVLKPLGVREPTKTINSWLLFISCECIDQAERLALIKDLTDATNRDHLLGSIAGESLEAGVNRLMARRLDAGVAEEAIKHLLELLSSAPGTYRAPILTLIAALQWNQGQGSRAGMYCAAAQLDVPGYYLAHLIDQMARNHFPPRVTV